MDTEQLMKHSKMAFVNMFNEAEILADDENAGFALSPQVRYMHKLRRDKWNMFFDKIWEEISSRGHNVKRQLIQEALENYQLHKKFDNQNN